MDNESFNTMSDATAASVKTRMKKQKSMKSRIFSAIKKKRGSTKQINNNIINNNNNNSVLKTKKSDNSFLSSRQNASSVVVVGKKENASMIESNNNKSQVTSSVNNKYLSPTVIIVPQDEDDDDDILVVVDDDHSKLQKVFPLATQEEIKRFLTAKNNQYDLAYEQLQKYFQWRNEYNLVGDELSYVVVDFDDDDDDDEVEMEDWHSCASSDETIDELDWKFASQKALAYTNTNKNKVVDKTIDVDDDNTSSLSGNMNFILPQLVRVITDNNNNNGDDDVRGTKRIVHLLPAQLDSSLASDDTYVLCIAYYLEQKLYRNSMEKLLIVLDLRGGYGWSNPTPYALLSFIKKLIECMEQNFPERLAQCLVFPMPAIAYMFWNMIKKLQILDPNTTEKIILVPGNAAIRSPPPYEKIEKLGCITKDLIDRMERTRLSSFCEKH